MHGLQDLPELVNGGVWLIYPTVEGHLRAGRVLIHSRSAVLSITVNSIIEDFSFLFLHFTLIYFIYTNTRAVIIMIVTNSYVLFTAMAHVRSTFLISMAQICGQMRATSESRDQVERGVIDHRERQGSIGRVW